MDDDAEYAEAVNYLDEIGIIKGDDKGNFSPDKPVSRSEMATIIARMVVGEENFLAPQNVFDDVPMSYWGNQAISTVARMNIVNEVGNNKFAPDDTVSYTDAITMLVRAMGLEDLAIHAGGYPDGYVQVACDCGYKNWLAIEKMTQCYRWQVAVMLYNALI